MSEAPANRKKNQPFGRIAAITAAALAVAAGVYFIAADQRKPQSPLAEPATVPGGAVTRSLATGALTAFVVKPKREPVPDLNFTDAAGKPVSLAAWRGRVVLLNLWATWCTPCRKEMPSLARLQDQSGSKDFEVIAVSLDRRGAEVASPFLKETDAAGLTLYLDPSTEALDRLKALGLPVSVLIDRSGREIGRLLGPADWASPEAKALIAAAVAEKAGG